MKHRVPGDGIRDIPISSQAADAIGKLPRGNASDLVFPSCAGTSLDPQNVLKRVVHSACDRAGVQHVGWKDFRHTHAKWLSELGEPLGVEQAQLGHSDMATTLQVYTHVVPASQRSAVDRLESILFPSVPKTTK